MRIAALILCELVGMFVDDEFLAFAVLAVVALAAALGKWMSLQPPFVGGVLLVGSVVIVVSSALRASRKRRT
ncbi:hypothetical protein [Mesorhizobium sp.]|uniref:hypothetical protein n=1 Tax=Mesorhizobium sp. TaxID=1871066 RepID=UPI00121EBFEB|nr:hypothetical protein [Mesorhizobium sp.]TIS57612.1 MAG: hypothetical protein E5W91_13725 [Mesorhizobium sp.]TIS88611.1 MAG: hypothetical protein E5W89_19810 [Mesorhizobium sp.]